jgi:type I restriction enzyme S subunit
MERSVSKETEIGKIPIDWKVIKLKEGLSLLKDGSHNPPKRVEKGIKFIAGATNIKYLHIDFNNCTFITERDYQKIHKYYEIKINDILLTIVGTVGNVAIVKESDLPFSLQRSIAILRCNEKVYYIFLFYWFNSPRFKKLLNSRLNPTAQPGIYLGELGKLIMPLPKYKEQVEIANILYKIDEKIDLNIQINNTLEAIGQELFKHWFTDFEFPNKNGESYKSNGGEMVFNDELNIKIPKEWRVDKLENVTKVIDCLHSKKPLKQGNKHIFLQVYNIGENGKLDMSDPYFISEKDYHEWTKRIRIKGGDIIISKTGRVGAIAQIPENFEAAIGRNLVCIRNLDNKIGKGFLKEYMLTSTMKKEIKMKTHMGTVLQSIHVKEIKKLRILMPTKDLIKKYEEIIDPLHKKINLNVFENYILSEIRDALIPKLLSGEIRINNMEKNS